MIGQWARLFTQLTTSDDVGARLFELGLEALQLDFLGKTTASLIGPPLAQKHRDTLRVVMGVAAQPKPRIIARAMWPINCSKTRAGGIDDFRTADRLATALLTDDASE